MKKILFILPLFFLNLVVQAQSNTGIGTLAVEPSAKLELKSSNQGFLPPRVALTGTGDVSTIASPATGLFIYNTATAGLSPNDVTQGYYYWGGSSWKKLETDNWKLSGNVGTNSDTNFLGTIDDQPLMLRINNITAGVITKTITSIGYDALPITTKGGSNTAVGIKALKYNTIGTSNTAVGGNSLTANVNGVSNTGLGYNSLAKNISGGSNTAMGLNALYGLTTGSSNVAVGTYALQTITTTNYNTAIGNYALYLSTGGAQNIAIGTKSLYNDLAGQSNVAIGYGSLLGVTGSSGNYNIGIGNSALKNYTTAANNIAIGSNSGSLITTATNNIIVGDLGLSEVTTGTDNTTLGHYAGIGLVTGNRNIYIGGDRTNNVWITASSAAANNEMNIGNTLYGTGVNNTAGNTKGRIGINAVAPSTTLHIVADAADDPLRLVGLKSTSTPDKILVTDTNGVVKTVATTSLSGGTEPWFIQNSTNSATANTDNIYQSGKVAIGANTMLGTETLRVNGTIKTAGSLYADYVFEDYLDGASALKPSYDFKSLKDVEAFINENKHLPGVTGIKELAKNEKGEYVFDLTELSTQLLEKVEELYLHTIEQQKLIDDKNKEINELKEVNKDIISRLTRLENPAVK